MCRLLWELKTCNLLFVHFTPGKSCHEGAENFCWGPSVTQLFHERRSAHHTLQSELASQFEFKNYFKLNIGTVVLKHMQAFSDCLWRRFSMLMYCDFLAKTLCIFELVTRVRTRDYTVFELYSVDSIKRTVLLKVLLLKKTSKNLY